MAWLRDIDIWFTQHVLPYAGHYRAYARRLTDNASDAEDLVQEAYAKVLSVPEWRRLEAPERFVLTVIRNLAFDRFRREKVVGIRQMGVLELNAFPDPTPDAHTQASSREELELVLAALENLPTQCRNVLILRKMHGLSPGQIADRLKLSVSTVEKHMARGVRLLTATLAETPDSTVESKRNGKWRKRATQTETD